MGDMAEVWRDHRARQKEERAERRRGGLRVIDAAERDGLAVVDRFPGGEHFRLTLACGVAIDFWPSSGRWRVGGGTRFGFQALDDRIRRRV